MSIYSINILYVGLSVRLQKAAMQKYNYRNEIFSTLNYNKQPFFSLHIPLIYKHLFLNIMSVSLSGWLQKTEI